MVQKIIIPSISQDNNIIKIIIIHTTKLTKIKNTNKILNYKVSVNFLKFNKVNILQEKISKKIFFKKILCIKLIKFGKKIHLGKEQILDSCQDHFMGIEMIQDTNKLQNHKKMNLLNKIYNYNKKK